MSTNPRDPLVVDAGHGLTLAVWQQQGRSQGADAQLMAGPWPSGEVVLFVTADHVRVGMELKKPESIWFGSTSIRLPWLELVKVADFLNLNIPLPVPLGEQVPA